MKSESVLSPPERLIQFSSIAVLTDLAEGYERPMRYAAMLARWYGARLIVAHAVAPDFALYMPPMPVLMMPAPAIFNSPKMSEGRARALTENLGLHDLNPEFLVRSEGIPELLAELAERRPGLIVLATHGRAGLEKWLAGSVAEEVFRKVNVPVLVLGPEVADIPGLQVELQTVLYCTDLSPVSAEALRCAAGMARDHEARLLCLHVQPDTSEGFAFHQAMDRQKLEDWMYDQIGPGSLLTGAQPFTEVGEPKEKIVEFAREIHADLIVLGARGLGASAGIISHLVGGVAYDVACTAKVPVMIVPHH